MVFCRERWAEGGFFGKVIWALDRISKYSMMLSGLMPGSMLKLSHNTTSSLQNMHFPSGPQVSWWCVLCSMLLPGVTPPVLGRLYLLSVLVFAVSGTLTESPEKSIEQERKVSHSSR